MAGVRLTDVIEKVIGIESVSRSGNADGVSVILSVVHAEVTICATS